MDIAINPQTSVSNNLQKSTEADKKTSLTSDYEMFLHMLTTQMTNQDPLNPVDSSDYAVQLATFSSVEQQVLTNDLLTELTSQLKSTGLSDLAGYVGRDVRSNAPAFFEGQPIDLVPDVAPGADMARLTVYNASGDVIQNFEIDSQDPMISWTGLDANGNMLPKGVYSFEVTSYEGDEILAQSPAGTYGRIIEAQSSPRGLQLILAGGVTVTPSDVTAMRE